MRHFTTAFLVVGAFLSLAALVLAEPLSTLTARHGTGSVLTDIFDALDHSPLNNWLSELPVTQAMVAEVMSLLEELD